MKHLFSHLTLFLLLVVGLGTHAFAQQTITGTVTDAETGDPLESAMIVIKGTNTGALTLSDGTFSLAASPGDVLVVSYVGMEPKEFTVGSERTLNVALGLAALIDEVVVIGYGTVKKSDVTGSVSKIDEEDFNQGAITSPEQLLDSRATGIQVVANSGAPGAKPTINIRGTSSIRSGNDPLIVIDGVQLDNRSTRSDGDVGNLGRSQESNVFAFIDPNQIASIEILKDASATAIYGSRGANGVILITTKRGRAGDPTVEYGVQQGVSNIMRRPDYLDAAGFRNALSVEGLSNASDFGSDVDAMDAISRTGYTNSHTLAVGGGGVGYNYRVFGSYFDQQGFIENSGLTKIIGGASGSFNVFPKDRLTIDMGITASNVDQDVAPITDDAGYEGSLIGAVLQWNPTKDLLKSDGTYDQDVVENRNPLAMVDYIRDNVKTQRIIANMGATLKLVKGLSYKFTLGLDNAATERRLGASPLINLPEVSGIGQAYVGNRLLGSTQLLHSLNYQSDFSDKFSLNLLAGYEYLKYTFKGTRIEATNLDINFPADLDLTDILGSAPIANQTVTSFHDPDVEFQSYFGRAILNYDQRYLLTATVRADGSSKFGENNKYGVFPSFALAWNIHNEAFAPSAFDELKLRAGYGLTGNSEFPAGAAQEYYEYENGALVQKNAPNPDLSWEASSQFNVGLDFAVLNSRLRGTIDFFSKTTNDLILFVPLAQPNPSEQGRIYRNVDGTISNSGLELGLEAFIVSTENLLWKANLNFTYLTNKVEGFSSPINTGAISGQGLTDAFAQRIENGQPLFSFYLPVWTGLNGEGLSEYEDPVNGGTTLIATVPTVKQHVGDPLPDVLLGFSTSVRYKGFDAILNFNGMFGYQIYNNTANALFVKGNIANGRNMTADLVGNGESLSNSYPASTRYLENGDHIRLSNLSVGYTFDNLPSWLKGARLSLTGQNLFLITGYSGFDPVVNTNKEISGIPSFGIEYTPYPTARTFTLGLNIKI